MPSCIKYSPSCDGNGTSKFCKVAQVMASNIVNDVPVNLFVVVYRDIPETNCFFEPHCERVGDEAGTCKRIECLTHRVRR